MPWNLSHLARSGLFHQPPLALAVIPSLPQRSLLGVRQTLLRFLTHLLASCFPFLTRLLRLLMAGPVLRLLRQPSVPGPLPVLPWRMPHLALDSPAPPLALAVRPHLTLQSPARDQADCF